MKKPGFLAASVAAASASTIITTSNHKNQDHEESRKRNEDSNKMTSCCSEKFAPRFDGLRFIETLVTYVAPKRERHTETGTIREHETAKIKNSRYGNGIDTAIKKYIKIKNIVKNISNQNMYYYL